MGIGQKLLAVMEACQYVSKDKRNDFHRYNYTSAESLFAKVNAELTKAGLYIAGTNSELLESNTVANVKGGTEKYAVVRATIKIGDTESDDKVELVGLGSGQDAGDKAIMKANTAAFKYTLLGGLCIAMGDDPETDSNTFAYSEPRNQTPPAKSNGNDDNKVVGDCEICGKPVLEKNMVYARKYHGGRMLCYKCQQDLKTGKNNEQAPF